VVFTPKAMLRLRGATSSVEDLTSGRFEPVIDDARITDRGAVTKVLLHSGKIHYDLASELQKNPNDAIALVRVEQFYPLPLEEINRVIAGYPNAELVWVQDEPQNQGAWPFICTELASRLDGRTITVASRPAAASPAAGSAKRHAVEQAELITRALS
jgi:2-oxoglutarate dehydrogenase E1 component